MGRGKLKFKGEKKAHKKSGSKKSSVGGESQHAADEGVVGDESATPTAASASASAAAGLGDKTDDAPLPSPKIVSGQGLISTSGTVVSGHGTAFKTELRTGDAIIATTPKGRGDEGSQDGLVSNINQHIISVHIGFKDPHTVQLHY
eukprot:g4313.t1 g4313   contig15:772122-772559(+)